MNKAEQHDVLASIKLISSLEHRMLIVFRITLGCLLIQVALSGNLRGQELYYHVLRNGMRLGPGYPSETDSISTNAFQRGGGGEVGGKSIGILDDGLRLTHHNQSKAVLLRVEESTAPAFLQLELPSGPEAVRTGDPPPIRGIRKITDFNIFGRRQVTFNTSRGPADVLQGITLLTPHFAKLEILRWKYDRFAWDSRIATTSIPAPKLREILEQEFDLTNSNEWLRMVSFYTQANRFNEARQVLDQALALFPTELATSRPVLDQLNQLLANQLFDEIKLRRQSGQHKLATDLLKQFPAQALPLETQATLNLEFQRLSQQLLLISEVSTALRDHVAKLSEADQQTVSSVVDEILNEVTLETDDRLADFQRLRRDNTLPNESKVALAISGWILGSGAGIDNFEVVKSLLLVRSLVKEYLDGAPQPRRQQILTQLRSQEGASPELIDLVLEYMKPPQALPQPETEQPEGLYLLRQTTPHGLNISYRVQVPPEYDPNLKYPCVLALPGIAETSLWEINWWCGVEATLPNGTKSRLGQATRHGYIVISPDWVLPAQTDYQYTEGEHDRILACLRDGLRKFSIDTDRIFISGHKEGGTAAWDIALSHPDLWAGAIMISPGAEKYIVQYHTNIQGDLQNAPLGTYIVFGEKDGTRFDSKLGTAATKYLESPRFDCMAVAYRGRGRERFAAELPRIMEWMQLSSHRRVRAPLNVRARTMRSGDRYFYWLEAPNIDPRVAGNTYQYNGKNPSSGTFEARRLDATNNGVNISKIPSINKSSIVWLTPEMVDFSRPIKIIVGGKRNTLDLTPDIGVMLEDARQRGDRMHVFWQRALIP